MTKSVIALIDSYIYATAMLRSIAIDENIYDVMVYGEGPGTIHYMSELSLGFNEQGILGEITEDD